MAPPAKRRKTEDKSTEVVFDENAREDYLTGFRKRKQQRIKHAKDEAAKKERALKIETRKHIREQRQKDLEEHVKAVNDMLTKSRRQGSSAESGDEAESDEAEVMEDSGKVEAPTEPRHEDEYIDEEKYTTVTVEPMDDEPRESDTEASGDGERDVGADQKPKADMDRTAKKGVWTNKRASMSKPKKKKKKFTYGTKVERRAERSKQRSKNSTAARTRREAGRS